MAATKSLRVLQDCQQLISSLFQHQVHFGPRIIDQLVPAVIRVASVSPPPPTATLPSIIAFRQAQVRFAALLAGFTKHLAEAMKPHSEAVADSVLSLFFCPSEQLPAALRKDVLAAVRNILSKDHT